MTCSRHLNLTDFEVGASCSIALQGKAKTGYPRVSRGSFLSGYGSFLCYYAHFLYILFPSFRILTAAFTSRSIRFPHSHRYIRSDNASSFFLCPHTLHILLDAKYLSTFIIYFHVLPAYIQAWKGTDRIRYPVSLFRNAGLRLSPSGSDPPHILRHSLLQGCG